MPEELDIAIAMARFEEMTHCEGCRPGNTWAGLRTFLPDLTPSIGFDDKADGFFWLVGQGGFGMQTAPAISQLAADMINEKPHAAFSAVAPGRKYRKIED
jgi:D-arginine dehydrogenase